MKALVCIVAGVFQLSGRDSVVVAPGIPRAGGWSLKIGDLITLRRPDGSEVETLLGGIELLSPPNDNSIPFMLGPGLGKEAVPLGTEIWAERWPEEVPDNSPAESVP